MDRDSALPALAEASFPRDASPAPRSLRFAFTGRGDELFVLGLKNLLLTLVTFGFYTPWARAALLRYTIENIEVDGDRLKFHGSGRELLKGFLVGVGVLLVVYALLIALAWNTRWGSSGVLPILFYPLGIALVGFATVASLRYRLSRTSWRGIRFSGRASISSFVGSFVLRALLVLVTLGLATPYLMVWRRDHLTNSTYFGTRNFGFDGEASGLFKRFLLAILLTLPTLGLIWIWYDAEQKRTLWNATTFDRARFSLNFPIGQYVGLVLTSAVLAVVTLGIAAPWAIVRVARFVAGHLTLDGVVDLESIRQEEQSSSAAGEGVADVFDVDLGIG